MKPEQMHENKLCMHIPRHLVKYEPAFISSGSLRPPALQIKGRVLLIAYFLSQAINISACLVE
jgi:hypothetical protein